MLKKSNLIFLARVLQNVKSEPWIKGKTLQQERTNMPEFWTVLPFCFASSLHRKGSRSLGLCDPVKIMAISSYAKRAKRRFKRNRLPMPKPASTKAEGSGAGMEPPFPCAAVKARTVAMTSPV